MSHSVNPIPVYAPEILDKEVNNVLDCLQSTWISSKGEYIERFESDFRAYVGARHACTVSNGTVALHLALLALNVGPGDDVLVPSLTYVASVNAIKYVGARPIFVDCDRETWQFDLSDVKMKVTKNTKAIIVVHLYGSIGQMSELIEFTDENDIKIVEDCAEALGSFYNTRHVGTFGTVATFSFFGNKTITTGEGGMVVSNDSSIDRVVRKLKGQGLAGDREYWHDVVGYNYRMTNIAAAIGCAQLDRLQDILKKKIDLAMRYRVALSHLPIKWQRALESVKSSHWMVAGTVEDATTREKLRTFLRSRGVETRPTFPPVHLMPMYHSNYALRNTEFISSNGICFPSWPSLPETQFKEIIAAVADFFS